MKQKTQPAREPNKVGAAILAGVEKLYAKHAREIADVQNKADGNTVRVSFTITVDGSGSELLVKTQIAFASRVTDNITAALGDPAQAGFMFLSPDERGAEGDSNE